MCVGHKPKRCCSPEGRVALPESLWHLLQVLVSVGFKLHIFKRGRVIRISMNTKHIAVWRLDLTKGAKCRSSGGKCGISMSQVATKNNQHSLLHVYMWHHRPHQLHSTTGLLQVHLLWQGFRHWPMNSTYILAGIWNWPVYLRHMFCETARPAYSTKPGVTTFHICIRELSQHSQWSYIWSSENCHNTHNDPTYDHKPIIHIWGHTINMHSCTKGNVKVNRETHISIQVYGHKRKRTCLKKKLSKYGNWGLCWWVNKHSQCLGFVKMCLYTKAPHTARRSIREQQAVNELLLSAKRSSPPLEGN